MRTHQRSTGITSSGGRSASFIESKEGGTIATTPRRCKSNRDATARLRPDVYPHAFRSRDALSRGDPGERVCGGWEQKGPKRAAERQPLRVREEGRISRRGSGPGLRASCREIG